MSKFQLTELIKQRHPIEDWRADVRDGYTRDSYIQWVKIEIRDFTDEDREDEKSLL